MQGRGTGCSGFLLLHCRTAVPARPAGARTRTSRASAGGAPRSVQRVLLVCQCQCWQRQRLRFRRPRAGGPVPPRTPWLGQRPYSASRHSRWRREQGGGRSRLQAAGLHLACVCRGSARKSAPSLPSGQSAPADKQPCPPPLTRTPTPPLAACRWRGGSTGALPCAVAATRRMSLHMLPGIGLPCLPAGGPAAPTRRHPPPPAQWW